jgi:hypothetical protein
VHFRTSCLRAVTYGSSVGIASAHDTAIEGADWGLTATEEKQMPTTLALALPTRSVAAGQLEFAVVCLFSLLGLTVTAAVLACASGETISLILNSMSLG